MTRRRSDGLATSPRIFALCPDHATPSGGVRKIYRHIDILNAHGFTAFVLHQKIGFQAGWFEHRTAVCYAPQTPLTPSDVLILPEITGPRATKIAAGVPRVIFNQNVYYTFKGYGPAADGEQTPYQDSDSAVLATLVVSEDSREYLAYAFPGQRVFRIHNSVDPSLFHDREPKQAQIAFMPRKNRGDVEQVINLLRCRGALSGFELLPIENQPEASTAQMLRQAMVFLSFGNPEGFNLPAAEAMACGCVTLGYHGRGGREFFTPEHGFPIEAGDVIGFAMTVEKVLAELRRDPTALLEKAKHAAVFIRKTYSPERERADVLEAWRQIRRRSDKM
jgi:glycosyltransferase involved in cell wall biosynthesis